MSASHPLVVVYADESCLGNGREGSNPGGAAGLIEYRARGGALVRRDFWVSEPATTNNRMALRSVLEAFRILSAKGNRLSVLFVSDSQYVVKGVTEWLPGWIRRGWRRSGGAIENLAMWQEVARALDGHEYAFRWVRGHAEHAQNEYANDLAVEAARTQTASGGAVESGFEAWLEARRAKGKRLSAPEPFPAPAAFRPAPALPPLPAARLA